MKSLPRSGPATKTLDQLVSLLATDSISKAVQRRSFIVSDVPKALPIVIDENELAAVLGRYKNADKNGHPGIIAFSFMNPHAN